MIIRWFGQSCFLLESDAGYRVVIDPFHSIVGYRLPKVSADLVTISHQHPDHNNRKLVLGSPRIVDTEASFEVEGVKVRTLRTWHSKPRGKKRPMMNLMFCFEIDNLRLCHAGDLGHVLGEELLADLGQVDILFLPVGGGPMINLDEACEIIDQVKPKLVIPMHYRTRATGLMGRLFYPLSKFVDRSGLQVWESEDLIITRDGLPSTTILAKLNYVH